MAREFRGEKIQRIDGVENGVVRITTRGGKHGRILDRREDPRTFPEGAVESLFRRLPSALSNYGEIVSSDPGWLNKIVRSAKYDTPEEAVSILRSWGISARKTAEQVYDLALNAGADVQGKSKEALVDALEEDIRGFYASSTEVRKAKSK